MSVSMKAVSRAQAALRAAPRQRLFSTSVSRSRELQDAYIIAAARTPVGAFGGAFKTVPAPQLAATAIKAALERSNIPSPENTVTAAYLGNVLAADMGQAPARQAVIASGLPNTVEATTINKVCSSGLKAVALASQQIQLGLDKALIAGGMENMSRTPYYLPRAGQMPPFGEIKAKDGMISDGLWDPYNNVHMGNCAENTATNYKISREAQDAFSIESYARAQKSWKAGAFKDEVVPVTVKGRKGDTVVEEDEGYNRLKLEKVPTLKPAFVKGGTVTAANSSSFNDGASAVVVVNEELAKQYGSKSRVLAKIISTADAATAPIDFTVAPAKAIPVALERAGLQPSDISVWEINEAFAAVVIANAKILGLEDHMDKINPLGGAIALGHAIGSSGSRILTTLLHQLKPGQFGCVGICNGGGAASSMIVQRVDSV